MAWDEEPIEVLRLTPAVCTSLKRGGVLTLGQLFRLGYSDLLGFRAVGVCKPPEPAPPALADEPLDWLTLPARAVTALEGHGIRTCGDLYRQTESALLRIRGLGRGFVKKILERRLHWLQNPPQGHAQTAASAQAEGGPLGLEAWVDLLFGTVTLKRKRVAILHFGLESGEPLSYAAVGKVLGSTRENVRVIGQGALRPLNTRRIRQALERVSRVCIDAIAENGDGMTTADLGAALAATYPPGRIHPAAFARFILPYCSGIQEADDGRWICSGVRDRQEPIERSMCQLLAGAGHPLPLTQLTAMISERHGINEAAVHACLGRSREVLLYGDWAFLRPWSGREKSVWCLAALYEIGRPAHFREVAARLPVIAPHLSQTSDQVVLGCLWRLPELERTGMGTYGFRRRARPIIPSPEGSPATPEPRSQQDEPASLKGWLDTCLRTLDVRTGQAAVLRYGLADGKLRSPAEIAQVIGGTHANVRMASRRAIYSLRTQSTQRRLEGLGRFCTQALAQNGGIMSTADLSIALAGRFSTEGVDPAAFARFVLQGFGMIRGLHDDWWILADRWDRYLEIEESIQQHLAEAGHPLPVPDLVGRVVQELPGATDDEFLVRACLRFSKRFRLQGDWCLSSMRTRQQTTPWAMAALYLIGRPAHVDRIAEVMRTLVPEAAHASGRSARLLLLRAPKVRRTGPLTYALRSWGIVGRVVDPVGAGGRGQPRGAKD